MIVFYYSKYNSKLAGKVYALFGWLIALKLVECVEITCIAGDTTMGNLRADVGCVQFIRYSF